MQVQVLFPAPTDCTKCNPQLVKKEFLTSWWTGEQAPPPRPPLPVSAEILRISGRGNCKEAIFALGNGISRRKNRPVPDVHGRFCRFFKSSKSVGFSRLENPMGFQPAAGNDLSAKGLRPSRALPWGFLTVSGLHKVQSVFYARCPKNGRLWQCLS